jgi:hypothetical protein
MFHDETQESLATLTWNRDFQLDVAAIREAHKAEFESFRNILPDAVAEQKTQLHPKQAFDVAPDRLSLSIHEAGVRLVACYTNWTTAGTVRLQFFDEHGNEIDVAELCLERYGEEQYTWEEFGTGVSVAASGLPAFIVNRLVDNAVGVVRQQTSVASERRSQLRR